MLEKGDTLNLDVLLKTAASHEAVQVQLESMKSKASNVNQIRDSRENKHHHKGKKTLGENKTCYRCGHTGHFGRDPECPAKGKTPARHVLALIICFAMQNQDRHTKN